MLRLSTVVRISNSIPSNMARAQIMLGVADTSLSLTGKALFSRAVSTANEHVPSVMGNGFATFPWWSSMHLQCYLLPEFLRPSTVRGSLWQLLGFYRQHGTALMPPIEGPKTISLGTSGYMLWSTKPWCVLMAWSASRMGPFQATSMMQVGLRQYLCSLSLPVTIDKA